MKSGSAIQGFQLLYKKAKRTTTSTWTVMDMTVSIKKMRGDIVNFSQGRNRKNNAKPRGTD
eukprot:2943284-Amphidinium_carterae.2